MTIYFPKLHTRNSHLTDVRKFFGNLRRDQADIPTGARFVFLCYTNRCGSSFLAEALSSSRQLNNAQEYINSAAVIRHAKSEGSRSFHEYFSWRIRHSSKGNILVCKLAIAHLELLGISGILDQIIAQSQFIFVERADKLAQAISFDIAMQTGMWKSTLKSDNPPPVPRFSAARLTDIMAWVAEYNRLFEIFFGRNGIVPVPVVYEHLVAAPDDWIQRIGRQIGLEDLRLHKEKMKLEAQSNQLNAEWRRRYMAEPSKYGSLVHRLKRATRSHTFPS